jgi:hypothetical protein
MSPELEQKLEEIYNEAAHKGNFLTWLLLLMIVAKLYGC